MEWTTQVGEAFLDQPADVMNTIQQLRAQAIAAGNLIDTPQQKIVKEEDCIRIVPVEPEVIYVPRYDPDVVYVRPVRAEHRTSADLWGRICRWIMAKLRF